MIQDDVELIKECIENDDDFKPKNGVMYEIYLDRARIASSFPIVEMAFAINRVVEKKYNEIYGHHMSIVEL